MELVTVYLLLFIHIFLKVFAARQKCHHSEHKISRCYQLKN